MTDEWSALEVKAKAATPFSEDIWNVISNTVSITFHCSGDNARDCDYELTPEESEPVLLALEEYQCEARDKVVLKLIAALRERDAEANKWKDEYENLCKFATDYDEQRDALRDQLRIAREALEFYAHHCQSAPYNWGDNIGSYDGDTGEKARAALEKIEGGGK